MNLKGQAFSTFQLLIAAIVAIIILGILLQVLGIVNFNPPSTAALTNAANAVQKSKVELGGHIKTDEVPFEPGTYISSKDIASKSAIGLSPEQICVVPDQQLSTETKNWKTGSNQDGTYVQNISNIALKVRWSVICDKESDIQSTINTRYGQDSPVGLTGDVTSSCGFGESQRPVCMVILRSE